MCSIHAESEEHDVLEVLDHDYQEYRENKEIRCMFHVRWDGGTTTWEPLENLADSCRRMIRNLMMQKSPRLRKEGIPKRIIQNWTRRREKLHFIPCTKMLATNPKAKILFHDTDDKGVQVYFVKFDRHTCFPVIVRKSVMEYFYPLVVVRYMLNKK